MAGGLHFGAIGAVCTVAKRLDAGCLLSAAVAAGCHRLDLWQEIQERYSGKSASICTVHIHKRAQTGISENRLPDYNLSHFFEKVSSNEQISRLVYPDITDDFYYPCTVVSPVSRRMAGNWFFKTRNMQKSYFRNYYSLSGEISNHRNVVCFVKLHFVLP